MSKPEELLGRVPIFSDLKQKDLKRLAKEVHELRFAAGTHLTDDDRFGSTFFVIEEGTVEVAVKGQPVRSLGPGDYFGEMSLVDRNDRSATVVAQTDVACLVMSRPVFRPFAYDHPEVAWALLEAMVARVREAESRYVS
jgi:CRP-like cAMP-binding protein